MARKKIHKTIKQAAEARKKRHAKFLSRKKVVRFYIDAEVFEAFSAHLSERGLGSLHGLARELLMKHITSKMP